MVRSSQLSSYINGDFGGGPIKAGLPYMVGRTSAVSYAFRQTSQNLTILKGHKYMLNKALQLAITALAAKQLIADAAVITLTNADNTLSDKYNVTVDLYNDGTLFNDDTDINAALSGLISPADDDKIAALNEILTARDAKNNAVTALNQSNQELGIAQSEKNAAQTAYDNA